MLPRGLHRVRHAKPGGVRGHLSAARGAARPLPAQGQHRLPSRDGRARDPAALRQPASTRTTWHATASRPCCTPEHWPTIRHEIDAVRVEPGVLDYILSIVRATRKHRAIALGASPRAGIALLRGTKALAAIRGKGYITPDEVQTLAPPVLRHRLLLTPESELEGGNVDAVIAGMLGSDPRAALAAAGPAAPSVQPQPFAHRDGAAARTCAFGALRGGSWAQLLHGVSVPTPRHGSAPAATSCCEQLAATASPSPLPAWPGAGPAPRGECPAWIASLTMLIAVGRDDNGARQLVERGQRVERIAHGRRGSKHATCGLLRTRRRWPRYRVRRAAAGGDQQRAAPAAAPRQQQVQLRRDTSRRARGRFCVGPPMHSAEVSPGCVRGLVRAPAARPGLRRRGVVIAQRQRGGDDVGAQAAPSGHVVLGHDVQRRSAGAAAGWASCSPPAARRASRASTRLSVAGGVPVETLNSRSRPCCLRGSHGRRRGTASGCSGCRHAPHKLRRAQGC